MLIVTASDASRRFSAVLDKAEHGETVIVTRGGRRIAAISPTPASNGLALLELSRAWSAPDDPEFDKDIAAAQAAATGRDEDAWAIA